MKPVTIKNRIWGAARLILFKATPKSQSSGTFWLFSAARPANLPGRPYCVRGTPAIRRCTSRKVTSRTTASRTKSPTWWTSASFL